MHRRPSGTRHPVSASVSVEYHSGHERIGPTANRTRWKRSVVIVASTMSIFDCGVCLARLVLLRLARRRTQPLESRDLLIITVFLSHARTANCNGVIATARGVQCVSSGTPTVQLSHVDGGEARVEKDALPFKLFDVVYYSANWTETYKRNCRAAPVRALAGRSGCGR